ncbi:MAG: hypothetical protein NC924_01070 [Candidatus Omnitrophica bacterium]|nr:hypothetical protein [Candidatus Omnitrophota bacterium]
MKKRTAVMADWMVRAVPLFVMMLPLSAAGMQGQNALAGAESIGRGERTDESSRVEKVPFVPTGAELPFVADAAFSRRVQDTVAGLKSAHYSIDEIVAVLKQDNRPAFEISLALLNNNYSGPAIHAALLKAGFSERAADAAVPVALRREGQLFPVKKSAAADAAPVRIRPNPLAARENESAQVLPARERIALVLADAHFAAVADWSAMVGAQFKPPVDKNLMEKGPSLVKVMLREGYGLLQIAQGFHDNKYEPYQIAVILGLAGISPEMINWALSRLK